MAGPPHILTGNLVPELCRFSLLRRFEKVNEEMIRTAESQKRSSSNLKPLCSFIST